ncbi:MAG TPA: helix-turn-helix domain-containing protein [Saprospiraceae bacterium]|nr:helix-turn-helix domain-containing protein [Saprospiraceae bacterium]HMQ82535.1 helix-turn-helix domain-containing protein [Saprospiraceae bacterium]
MIAEFYTPDFPLCQFIEHFFYYRDYSPLHDIDRLLPEGDVQLIFDLTDRPKPIFDNHSLKEIQSCRKAWFSGFRTIPITIPSGKEDEMLIVQFRKGKAHAFLKTPMHALLNSVVDAEQVLQTTILQIWETLMEMPTPALKFHALEQELLQNYAAHLHENPFVDFAVAKILAFPNQSSIRAIADKAGYSQKHIIKLFKEQVGVTPKTFLKVIRFQKAIQQIEQKQTIDWSAVTYDCGFYDQSHFIADFKAFSGLTPTEYLYQRGEFLNYVPIK